jgi:selenocysteine lyase/cysteine desulfurase
LRTAGRRLRVGAFSAVSNVTGIVTDVDRVTTLLKRHGALAVWDYAGGAPYLAMDVAGGAGMDAVVFSPHKFHGGPGASGVLIVRRSVVATDRPTWPGGGSVSFVSPWSHDYAQSLVAREEAGTPNVVGDIRAALALLVKEAVGQAYIDRRNAELNSRALSVWRANPRLRLLGTDKEPRLPIFSFQVQDGLRDGQVQDGDGGLVHHQLFTRMLSDCFGIQARGGCACAGPYAHRLLGIDREASARLRDRLRRGEELARPGWVRLNFSFLLDDVKAGTIVACVDKLARSPFPVTEAYASDPATARFWPIGTKTTEASEWPKLTT